MEHDEDRALLAVIEEVNTTLNGLVWGPPLMILLIGTGLYLSVRLGFIQFTHVVFMWRTTFGRLFARRAAAEEGELSSFQAVSSAMAATVGVGNIAGVSTAIALGGPGALFWMWMTAVVGMTTKFSEVVLGMQYRQTHPTDWTGVWWANVLHCRRARTKMAGRGVCLSDWGGSLRHRQYGPS